MSIARAIPAARRAPCSSTARCPAASLGPLTPNDIPRATVTVGGTNFQVASLVPIGMDQHHRLALVSFIDPTNYIWIPDMYLDGQVVASAALSHPRHTHYLEQQPADAAQFNRRHDRQLLCQQHPVPRAAMTPEMLAGIGSPDNGPPPANEHLCRPTARPVGHPIERRRQPHLDRRPLRAPEGAGLPNPFILRCLYGVRPTVRQKLVGNDIVSTAVVNLATEGPSRVLIAWSSSRRLGRLSSPATNGLRTRIDNHRPGIISRTSVLSCHKPDLPFWPVPLLI